MKPYFDKDDITIYRGDCLEIMPELEPVDLVLTDPPYLHKHIDGGGFARKARFYNERRLADISNFDFDKYIPEICKKTGFLIAFHSRDLIFKYAKQAYDLDWKYDLHIWHKTNAVPFTNNTWKSDLEYIALLWKNKPNWKNGLNQKIYEKGFVAPLEVNRLHPAQKPLRLIKKYIQVLQPETTLDPMMGSGTILVAAKQLNCRAIGIEIEEKYCEIAAKRVEAAIRLDRMSFHLGGEKKRERKTLGL